MPSHLTCTAGNTAVLIEIDPSGSGEERADLKLVMDGLTRVIAFVGSSLDKAQLESQVQIEFGLSIVADGKVLLPRDAASAQFSVRMSTGGNIDVAGLVPQQLAPG